MKKSEDFWYYVRAGDIPSFNPSLGNCWVWTGVISPRGYGRYQSQQAHRWVYEREVGPIPKGLQIDHLCRVRRCVNPHHLEPVTLQENMRRSRGLRAKPTCARGHPYTEDNTYLYHGRRLCRTCNKLHQVAYRERVKVR